jgi:anti-sigma-K factor RskA
MTYKEMLEKSRRDLPLILAAVASGRSQAEVAIEFDITKQAVSLKVCNARRQAAKKRSKKP